MKIDRELLKLETTPLGISPEQVEALAQYAELMASWNAKVNLTRITSAEEVRVKHLVDSLMALRLLPADARSVLDVGSGAGLPGIPWAICRPQLEVVMVDSVGKKVQFLKNAIARGKLRARALHERVGEDSPLRAQWVTSRAFTDLPAFLKIARPLIDGGGVIAFLGPKGGEVEGFTVEEELTLELPRGAGVRRYLRLVPRGT